MKRFLAGGIGCILVILPFLSSCVTPKADGEEGFHHPAPVLLPGTTSAMSTPGFWIGIHPDPDRVVIPSVDLDAFNRTIRKETGMIQDPSTFPDTFKGPRIENAARGSLRFIASRKYLRRDGTRADAAFFGGLKERMNLSSIPEEIPVRLALVTAPTHQRILPTDEELYSSVKSTDLDRLQNSAFDIGTPLAVFHATSDGHWVYTIAPLSEGWIKSGDIAYCTREQMVHYLGAEPFAVTTGAKTDLFLDQGLRRHHAYARMGCRFPSLDIGIPGVIEVLLPLRNAEGSCELKGAFVMEGQVSRGYLPYTPRTVILQAFKLLHSPYGWGDMHGEQDCSRFIQEIFATVGIQFPRNSLQQAKVGRLIDGFAREADLVKRMGALSDASLGGACILHMNGHIMLFLGSVDGVPYAIHDMRGYSEPNGEGERFRLVNRVVVSSLHIGEGTKTGAYLKRLVTVRAIENGSSGRKIASP